MFGSRNNLRSNKFVLERRKTALKKFYWAVFLFLILSGGIIYLLNLPQVNIKGVTVVNKDFVYADEAVEKIQKEISGKYLYIIPKTSIFFYPKKAMLKKLYDDYPQIKKAGLGLKEFINLEIAVEERNPVALWCESDDNCYFIDEDGYIYQKSPRFSGDVYSIYKGGVAEGNDPIKKYFIETDIFKGLQKFLDNLQKIHVEGITTEVRGDGDIAVITKENVEIIFNKTDDLEKVVNNLNSIMSEQTDQTGFMTSLDYIDLRFGNKIFYKKK